MDTDLLLRLAFSLAVGALLGLERERGDSHLGGIRTFPIIALFGTLSALLAQEFGAWVLAAGIIAITIVTAMSNYARVRGGEGSAGATTEVAALVVYVLGAFIAYGSLGVAALVAGTLTVLLHYKAPMHQFAGAVGRNEMTAIMKFVLLALIILPVLPNENYGPYEVLNPWEIWLMVVLIVGLTLAGYVSYRVFGTEGGSILGGLFGGLISSTATSVSYARLTSASPKIGRLAALVIMIASTVSFSRVLIEIGAVAPRQFAAMGYPLAAMLGWCAVISAAFWWFARRDDVPEMPEQENPAQLKSALVFGGLYALVLLAVAAAKQHYGQSGLYVVGFISGLTDMDAITLSTANLAEEGRVEAEAAWRTILIASLANFLFKFGIVAVLGKGAVKLWTAVLFVVAGAGGGLIFWLWPN